MHEAKIALSSKTGSAGCFAFARELDYYANHEKLSLDFSGMEVFSPFSMLFLSCKLKSFVENNPNVELVLKGHQHQQYAAHMGFFRMFGVEHGRDVGEAWGGAQYLPITRVQRADLFEGSSDRFQELPDLIQRRSERLADLLMRDRAANPDLHGVLSYCLREIMRNVFEHSRVEELYYCAQFWPRSNKVELVIADFGVGVRRGLAENPNFKFPDDKQAIEFSLLPSVSGKTHAPRQSEIWFNSGYGLYMTNRLARHGGSFSIASGLAGMHLSKKSKVNFETAFPGTIIRISLHVPSLGGVEKKLIDFKEDGFKLAKTIKGSANRPPSAMSLLLRRDFS